jgi:hypothetical protein
MCNTLGVGLGRTSAGLGRIGYVSAGSQCFQGLEAGSSPTSGTVFRNGTRPPRQRGLLP